MNRRGTAGWTTALCGAGCAWILCSGALAAGAVERGVEGGTIEEAAATAVRRDPFWPVGYVPPVPGQAPEDAAELSAARTWPALPVRGRSRAPDGKWIVWIQLQELPAGRVKGDAAGELDIGHTPIGLEFAQDTQVDIVEFRTHEDPQRKVGLV